MKIILFSFSKASILPGLNFNLPAAFYFTVTQTLREIGESILKEMYTLGTLIIIYRNSISFQSEQDHIQARRSQDNEQMDTFHIHITELINMYKKTGYSCPISVGPAATDLNNYRSKIFLKNSESSKSKTWICCTGIYLHIFTLCFTTIYTAFTLY